MEDGNNSAQGWSTGAALECNPNPTSEGKGCIELDEQSKEHIQGVVLGMSRTLAQRGEAVLERHFGRRR